MSPHSLSLCRAVSCLTGLLKESSFLLAYPLNHLFLISLTLCVFHPAFVHSSAHYTEYNLADYCSQDKWSDYPGRHRIRLEKTRVEAGRADFWPINEQESNRKDIPLVPYCLLTFYSDHGHRIYAEGSSRGLYNGGKDWFTETLHFKVGSGPSVSSSPSSGSFAISSEKNSLSLVFEQMHQGEFTFHLVLTPFREGQASTFSYEACDVSREYHCMNGRCIAHYLTCDHHNNCGDHSDEALNCLSNVPTTTSTTTRTPPPFSSSSQPLPWPPPHTPPEPSLPIFPVTNGRDKHYPPDGDNSLPEYVDVPLPPSSTASPGSGYPYPPSYYYPVNGHGKDGRLEPDDSGLLRNLFAFEAKTSSVVHIVRYLLGVLVIIVIVTLINLFIWCVITKRDSSFMAPAPQPATPPPPLPAPTIPVFAV